MNDPDRLSVPAVSLPANRLRTLPAAPVHEDAAVLDASLDLQSLSRRLEPLISAAIARKTRQRRYTP